MTINYQTLATDCAYSWVDSDQGLKELCALVHQHDFVAMDTEFFRRSTYYPRLVLVQVAFAEKCCLIDAQMIKDWQPLRDVLGNPKVNKVMHACREDLSVLSHEVGELPNSLRDTQIAAAFLGRRFNIGYQALVQDMFGVLLDKEPQCSRWEKRPLSDRQLQYAACDVIFLQHIYLEQQIALRALKREAAFVEECERVLQTQRAAEEDDLSYLKKCPHRVAKSPISRTVWKDLCVWREEMARHRDLPRRWLIKDKQLVDIAQALPQNLAELASATFWNGSQLKNWGQKILHIVHSHPSGSVQNAFQEVCVARDSATTRLYESKALDMLYKKVGVLAERDGIARELLATRSNCKKLLADLSKHRAKPAHQGLSSRFNGWRRPYVEELFAELETMPYLSAPQDVKSLSNLL